MRFTLPTLAVLALATGPAAATDVCDALLEEEGAPVVLAGVLSFDGSEFYVSADGCSMIVDLPDDMRDVCPVGSQVMIGGEVDWDFAFVTDDLILYAEEIDCP
jgi:hypothetical protein